MAQGIDSLIVSENVDFQLRKPQFDPRMSIAIIGGGPAGLRAAEVAAAGGASVTLFDTKASVGRKFLVAGKGGLNLTNAAPREQFVSRYGEPAVKEEEEDPPPTEFRAETVTVADDEPDRALL